MADNLGPHYGNGENVNMIVSHGHGALVEKKNNLKVDADRRSELSGIARVR